MRHVLKASLDLTSLVLILALFAAPAVGKTGTAVSRSSDDSLRANPPDPQWSQWFGSYEGYLDIYGTVYDMLVFEDSLYVCGSFTIDTDGDGSADIHNIARWNETTWEEVDESVSSWRTWRCLVEYDGDLYGGGDFGIDRFDGYWFYSFADFAGRNEIVYTMLADGDDLYAGGSFLTVQGSGITVNNVALYDGGWNAIPSFIEQSGIGVDDDVNCLATYQGAVFVGGDFFYYGSPYVGKIAEVSGGALVKVANGLSGWSNYHGVYAMIEYAGHFYAGGAITDAHQSGGGTLPVQFIVEYDGASWSGDVSGGIDFHCFSDAPVLDMAVFDDDGSGDSLFVGGHFIQDINWQETKRIAKWDGSQWCDVRGGMVDSGCDSTVWCLQPFAEDLYVGGEFSELANREPYSSWNNSIYVSSIARYATQDYLAADSYTIPENAGRSINILLDAGLTNAGRDYVLLGGVTGTSPGMQLPLVTLPLNYDVITETIIGSLNSPAFVNFLGTLDGNGQAYAQLNVGPIPGYAWTPIYFAAALLDPIDYASDPIVITIVP